MTDRDDIAEMLSRYAVAIDSRDWPLFSSCFTADVDANYGEIGHWHGVEEISAFMRQVHSGPSMHRLSTMSITVDGDQATARTYVDAIVLGDDARNGVNAIGFYDDRILRSTAGWRIAQRTFTGVRTTVLTDENLL